MSLYLIKGPNDTGWSDGRRRWVPIRVATTYNEHEKIEFGNLPEGGEWQKLGDEFLINVDFEVLPKQIELLSGLLAHLSNEQYETAVGGVQLLEEILKQKPG